MLCDVVVWVNFVTGTLAIGMPLKTLARHTVARHGGTAWIEEVAVSTIITSRV